jgi:hypothetical protein
VEQGEQEKRRKQEMNDLITALCRKFGNQIVNAEHQEESLQGGITVMDTYKVNMNLLITDELRTLITGLKII